MPVCSNNTPATTLKIKQSRDSPKHFNSYGALFVFCFNKNLLNKAVADIKK